MASNFWAASPRVKSRASLRPSRVSACDLPRFYAIRPSTFPGLSHIPGSGLFLLPCGPRPCISPSAYPPADSFLSLTSANPAVGWQISSSAGVLEIRSLEQEIDARHVDGKNFIQRMLNLPNAPGLSPLRRMVCFRIPIDNRPRQNILMIVIEGLQTRLKHDACH